MNSPQFNTHQTIFLTNKCNLRCEWCIVIDKNTTHYQSIFNERLAQLLVDNDVEKARISWWEPFMNYKLLSNFSDIMYEAWIEFSEIFTNWLSEKTKKTNFFLQQLERQWSCPTFNLSIDDIHWNTVPENLSLIDKLTSFWITDIVINSSSFNKKVSEQLIQLFKELRVRWLEDKKIWSVHATYDYKWTQITVNIKGMYKVINFEDNQLKISDSFWDYPINYGNHIHAIWYNSTAYLSETFAYTGLPLWYALEDNWNSVSIEKFQNAELLEFTKNNSLNELFQKAKKVFPDLNKSFFNVPDEFLIWILKHPSSQIQSILK